MESNGLLYGGREIDLLHKTVQLSWKKFWVLQPKTTSMQTERAADVLLPLTCCTVLLFSIIQRFLFDKNIAIFNTATHSAFKS